MRSMKLMLSNSIDASHSHAIAAFFLAGSLLLGAFTASAQGSGRKKVASLEMAELLAQRCIVESVYGVILNFSMKVDNLSEYDFKGSAEASTGKRFIKSIEFAEEVYDPKQDIAQVTASIKLSRLKDVVDKDVFNVELYPDMTIQRVAFATSTKENSRKIGALRAAEIDAYRKLSQKITGIAIESSTTVRNFVLTSDTVQAKLKSTIMMAEFVSYRFDGDANDTLAVVKLKLKLKELNEMLGMKISDDEALIEVEGRGLPATDEDLALAKKEAAANSKSSMDDAKEKSLNFSPNSDSTP